MADQQPSPADIAREQLHILCDTFFNGRLIQYLTGYRFNSRHFSTRQIFKEAQRIIAVLDFNQKNEDAKRIIHVAYTSNTLTETYTNIYANAPEFDYIIHGSVADNTTTSQSDVDDVIIVRPEAFASFAAFRKTRRILRQLNAQYQRVDTLQHHGHWIFTYEDLLRYNQSVMPLSVLEPGRATAIGRDLDLEFHIVKDQHSGENRIFTILLDECRRQTNLLFQNKLNLYYLKDLISSMSLLIPLAFQQQGTEIDKKSAIEAAGKLLDEQALGVLRWTTHVRKEWSQLPTFRLSRSLRVLTYIWPERQLTERAAKKMLPKIKAHYILRGTHLTAQDFEHYFAQLEGAVHAR